MTGRESDASFGVDIATTTRHHDDMSKTAHAPRGDKVRVTLYLPESLYVALRVRAARERSLTMSVLAQRYVEAGLRAEGVDVDKGVFHGG